MFQLCNWLTTGIYRVYQSHRWRCKAEPSITWLISSIYFRSQSVTTKQVCCFLEDHQVGQLLTKTWKSMMYASPCTRGPTSCPSFHSRTQILIFKYSQSEENMYDCLLLDIIRLSLYLQKLSNISITFHFLENFLQCYMYLQQIRFITKLLIITPLF